jgi:ubiquinone/menaquinone biosynthesis C-methylase UbiE
MYNANKIKEYFKRKAKDYDLVDKQLYWRLSDDLLWHLLRTLALDNLKGKNISVMDAGGGTGRWLIRIVSYLKNSKGTLYDFSEEMLSVARTKVKKHGLEGKITPVNGNIENMADQKDSSYDLVICFHNVFGFVNNPMKAFSEMTRILKKGGYLVMVVPNKYHMLFFDIFTKNIKELKSVSENSIGRFTKDMPSIHVFTPNEMASFYSTANFKDVKILGFPVTIYPQSEETQISGSSKKIKAILKNKKAFKIIENLEEKIELGEETAARGNNLFTIGRKQPS